MSVRTQPHIQGTRWNWIEGSVFHARRRISVSGYEIDLVLEKQPISLYAYENDWLLTIENNEGERLVNPINLGAMVTCDAIKASESIARAMIVGKFTF